MAKKCTKKRARAKLLFFFIKPIALVAFPLSSPSLDLKVPITVLEPEQDRSIAKARVRFPVKPEFFQVLFQPLRLFILLRGSFPLS